MSTSDVSDAPKAKIDQSRFWGALLGFLGSMILWIAFLVLSNLP